VRVRATNEHPTPVRAKRIQPPGRYQLKREQIVSAPREAVFAYFADAGNLQQLTPDFLGFRILTPLPIAMEPGARIEYRIKLHGIPVLWETRITAFKPLEQFVDAQVRGPYALWHHLHTFEETEAGTRLCDVVDYEPAFGILGRLAHPLFVRPTLERIFDYRAKTIAKLFGTAQPG